MFLQILVSNVVLVFLLITVHEVGHWFFGRLAGIPGGQMRIRLLTFPQQVQLRGESGWLSVSRFDEYFAKLREYVPSVRGQFAYVVGGFVFETLFLGALSVALIALNYKIYAMVAPGLSLVMYVVYVFAMDIPQSRSLKRPWGDTSILFSLARGPAITVTALMVGVRVLLILAALIWA